MENKRLNWIDAVKFFAIYLMIVAHLGTWRAFDKWIHAFHMPIFFLVSGYCYRESAVESFGTLVKKRFRSLIIPYVVFGVGLFGMWNAGLYVLKRYDEMRPMTEMLSSMFGVNAEITTFGVIQWFLTCMFLCSLLFYGILKAARYFGGVLDILLLTTSVVAYLIPVVIPIRLPWSFDSAVVAVVFYGVGWRLKKLNVVKYLDQYPIRSCIVSIAMLAIGSVCVFRNIEVNIRCISYGNYFLFYFCAFALSVSFCALSYLLYKVEGLRGLLDKLAFLGRHTLIILLLNSTFVRIWRLFSEKWVRFNAQMGYAVHLVVAFAIVVAATGVSVFVQRYMPELVGKARTKKSACTD